MLFHIIDLILNIINIEECHMINQPHFLICFLLKQTKLFLQSCMKYKEIYLVECI